LKRLLQNTPLRRQAKGELILLPCYNESVKGKVKNIQILIFQWDNNTFSNMSAAYFKIEVFGKRARCAEQIENFIEFNDRLSMSCERICNLNRFENHFR